MAEWGAYTGNTVSTVRRNSEANVSVIVRKLQGAQLKFAVQGDIPSHH